MIKLFEQTLEYWFPYSAVGRKFIMKIIFIFIDGVGIGENDHSKNPFVTAASTVFPYQGKLETIKKGVVVPTDATLGVEGFPQSATGQTTLFTGINAPLFLGHHLWGFPNTKLNHVLSKFNILKRIREKGGMSTFINTYRPMFFITGGRLPYSVTTVSAVSAGVRLNTLDDIRDRRSLYHDFTCRVLINEGYDVPLFTPEEAGKILANSAMDYDFTLYEYFLTDRSGHDLRDTQKAVSLVKQLEIFIESVLQNTDLSSTLVILSSDHGNFEDLSQKGHTKNPVPTILWGIGREEIGRKICSLCDVTPALLEVV